ncbi:UNVERIFIED_CONTAM: hypothetical protein PYX00_008357 [Menopon gallinae]|uniref:Uncharacterized protein n=1 Tax=Menopon gallinae TaxID=328185 RepID=A0AAW2HP12_9NEOP
MKEEKQLETQFKKPTEKRGIPVLKNRLKDKGRVKGVEASFAGQSYSEKFSSKEDEDFPVNYSLKYSETGDYNRNHTSDGDLEKENFEAYPDYAETDIDQPTDFSLKYGEETKESGYDSGQPELEDTTRAYYMEGTPNEGTPYNYSMPDLRIDHVNEETFPDDKEEGFKKKTECTDITPLMFSRSSSVDSLSSFEEILQSIPDDRSSVVSDFSRVTSGIISPSELPDSPTQTVPPSPKQSEYFPGKLDDVPDCKKADPHPDCSRVSNIRSLNVESNPKEDNTMINTSKSEVRADYSKIRNPKRVIQKNQSLEQIVPDKNKLDAEKLELESVSEMEENILADCINIGLQEYSRRSPVKHVRGTDRKRWDLGITQIGAINCERPSEGRPNRRSTFQNESRKIYSTYEELDDVVHTYYTEGTPANVSHAGSHSDLSNLSIFTDGLILFRGGHIRRRFLLLRRYRESFSAVHSVRNAKGQTSEGKKERFECYKFE